MKKIYILGIFTGNYGHVSGYAVDRLIENNSEIKINVIANHLSSDEYWCKHDMGIVSDWQHDIYNKLYPDGYELVWLGCFDYGTDVYNLVINKFQKELSN